MTLEGAYLLPLKDSFDLAGFDFVGSDWFENLPPTALSLDEGLALTQGERYNLVLVVSLSDADLPATLSGFDVFYEEGGKPRLNSVGDRVVLKAEGSC